MKENYLKIPDSVLFHKNLTWLEKVIISYRLSFGEKYFASNEFVAERFSTSKKTVRAAFRRGRELGFLPQEQMLMDDIMYQSGSLNPIKTSYGKVTGSNDTVRGAHHTVQGAHHTVQGAHHTVQGAHHTVQVPGHYGPGKEAVLPMKTDVLLDQYIRSDRLDQLDKESIIEPVDNETVTLEDFENHFYKKPDVIKSSNESQNIESNKTQNIKPFVSNKTPEEIINFGSRKLNMDLVSAKNKTKLKPDYVYYRPTNSLEWLGLSQTDYDKAAKLISV